MSPVALDAVHDLFPVVRTVVRSRVVAIGLAVPLDDRRVSDVARHAAVGVVGQIGTPSDDVAFAEVGEGRAQDCTGKGGINEFFCSLKLIAAN